MNEFTLTAYVTMCYLWRLHQLIDVQWWGGLHFWNLCNHVSVMLAHTLSCRSHWLINVHLWGSLHWTLCNHVSVMKVPSGGSHLLWCVIKKKNMGENGICSADNISNVPPWIKTAKKISLKFVAAESDWYQVIIVSGSGLVLIGTKPLSETMMMVFSMSYGITKPQ